MHMGRLKPQDRRLPRDVYPSLEWPHIAPDAPPELVVVAGAARVLATEVKTRSLRSLASASGVSPSTISRIVNGQTWPNVREIARLEAVMGQTLWSSVAERSAGPCKEGSGPA